MGEGADFVIAKRYSQECGTPAIDSMLKAKACPQAMHRSYEKLLWSWSVNAWLVVVGVEGTFGVAAELNVWWVGLQLALGGAWPFAEPDKYRLFI